MMKQTKRVILDPESLQCLNFFKSRFNKEHNKDYSQSETLRALIKTYPIDLLPIKRKKY